MFRFKNLYPDRDELEGDIQEMLTLLKLTGQVKVVYSLEYLSYVVYAQFEYAGKKWDVPPYPMEELNQESNVECVKYMREIIQRKIDELSS